METKEKIKNAILELQTGQRALSYSSLSKFMRSPWAFLMYLIREFEPTPSMIKGQIVHKLVLEPEKVELEYYTDEKIVAEIGGAKPRATKAYKEWKAIQAVDNPKATLVSSADMDEAKSIANAVLRNNTASKLVEGLIEREKGIEFTHKGHKLRGFIDGIGANYLMDLKTCADAEPRKFQRAIIDLKYYLQAAVYTLGMGGEIMPFYLIAVDGQLDVSVHELSEEYIIKGMDTLEQLLIEIDECLKTSNFSHSFDFRGHKNGIYYVDTPPWL